ncbi:MAG: hypothetical protein EXR36_05040, partial [Betaproteobacteria bacterium]|nr:hypothetical protein [Betaproteobacteria bacterium]
FAVNFRRGLLLLMVLLLLVGSKAINYPRVRKSEALSTVAVLKVREAVLHVVCSCLNVTDAQIISGLTKLTGTCEERVKSLQGTLRCGTNCGSCLLEVRRIVEDPISQPMAA